MILRQLWSKKNLFFSRSSTIFALATGYQIRSGVAIIRVSGPSATQSLLKLTRETNLDNFQPKKLYLKKSNNRVDSTSSIFINI